MNGPLTLGQGRANIIDRFGALDGAAAARTGRADGFVSANAVSLPARKRGAIRLRDAVKRITQRKGDAAIELDQPGKESAPGSPRLSPGSPVAEKDAARSPTQRRLSSFQRANSPRTHCGFDA
jgi:hypothetical protein